MSQPRRKPVISNPFAAPTLFAQEADDFNVTRDEYRQAYEKDGLRRTIAVLRRRGADIDSADELAQAAWCRGWEHLSQLKDSTRVVAWVASIAINAFRDEIAKSRRIVPLMSAGYEQGIAPLANVTFLDLHVAIRRCPARQRALLEAVLEGRTVDELAASLAVSTGAVHHRLSRARRALRRAMHAA
jgi:RNA polymerase sigma factor (sigma-70 family)